MKVNKRTNKQRVNIHSRYSEYHDSKNVDYFLNSILIKLFHLYLLRRKSDEQRPATGT